MKTKALAAALCALFLSMLAATAPALAQERKPIHFSGLINDFTPLTANVKNSPWEMHGQWSLDIYPERGTADFSADMTMSGFGRTPAGAVDPGQPLVNPHTHHIRLLNATISRDISNCPTYLPPATKIGFQLNDVVKLLTGNGSIAPFETDPPSSTLQVCVSGGDEEPYSLTNSNITLVFAGPAATHFGSQAIHGVTRITAEPERGRHRE